MLGLAMCFPTRNRPPANATSFTPPPFISFRSTSWRIEVTKRTSRCSTKNRAVTAVSDRRKLRRPESAATQKIVASRIRICGRHFLGQLRGHRRVKSAKQQEELVYHGKEMFRYGIGCVRI